jgi:hypothetical protein
VVVAVDVGASLVCPCGRLEKMWMPKSEQDILSAIAAGDLVETANFDAKAALPGKGKSKDLAVDVAAMSAEGSSAARISSSMALR